MQPDATSIEELHCIPFLDDDLLIQALQQEVLNYLNISEDTADKFDTLQGGTTQKSYQGVQCNVKRFFFYNDHQLHLREFFPFAELFYASKRKGTRRLH